MPKKFTGENTKAVAAKEKKQKVKDEANLKKTQEIQEDTFKDVSKALEKKLKRKEEDEKKRQEHLNRKAELREFLKKETEIIIKRKIQSIPKPTRAQIDSNLKIEKPATTNKTEKNRNDTLLTASLTENINRLSLREETARTINQAIDILNNHKKIEDRHPEKRLKAAHKAFEEKRLQELKAANPTLKLSQLKQMVFKEWQKMQTQST